MWRLLICACALALALLTGCSSGGDSAAPSTSTTAARPASTSSTLPPGIDRKLLLDLESARKARVNGLATATGDPNSLQQAKNQSKVRVDTIATYLNFVTAHRWPPRLQADVDAVVTTWNAVAAPFKTMQSLPATGRPADVNRLIDESNAALPAAGTADEKLSKDLQELLCAPPQCTLKKP